MEKDKIKATCKTLIIGGSAGSLEVILKILPDLKLQLPFAIVIVLHRKNSSDSSLPDLLATRTQIPVKEIEDKQPIRSSHIYIAPADYHLLFEKNNIFSLDFSEKVNYSRPSLDVVFESASYIYEKDLVCVFLSGANADGVEGLRIAKKNGAFVISQDPEMAESPYMPQQAIKNNVVDLILPTDKIAAFINSL